MPLSFGQVEAALAAVHDIDPAARSAFSNRLKHFQKLGFLPEIRTGRGKAADYRGQHAYLLGVALQFVELGLTPERAMRAVNQNIDFIAIPTRWALESLNENPDNPSLWFLRFDPSSLNSLRYPESEDDDASFGLFYAGVGTLREAIEQMGTLWPRIAVVNITSLVAHLYAAFHEANPISAAEFESDLTEWLSHQADDGLKTDNGYS